MSIPGLTTRETATIAWVAGFLIYACVKDGSIRSAFAFLFKTVFGSTWLVGLLAAAVAYTGGTVALLYWAGYWDGSMLKTTIIWFVGVGLVSAFSTKRKDDAYFRRLVLYNVSAAVLIEVFVNLHTFPLYVELLLVPTVFFLVMTHWYAQKYGGDTPNIETAEKFLGGLLTIVGTVILAFSLVYVVRDFEELATWREARELALPLLLTLLFVPFLYAFALVVVYQGMLGMVRFGIKGNEAIYRYARREIIRACGLSLARVQLFEDLRGRLWGASSTEDVRRVVAEFHSAWDARHATHVSRSTAS